MQLSRQEWCQSEAEHDRSVQDKAKESLVRFGIDAVVHEGAMVVEYRAASPAVAAVTSPNALPGSSALIPMASNGFAGIVACENLARTADSAR